MKTIVVGCGRAGAELAYRLYQKGHDVTVIDAVAAAFEKLPADFRGRTLEGDVLTEDLHHRCGMAQAQGLAAVTNSDSLNAVIGHIAHNIYKIPHVVVRNYDPRRRAFCDAFGLPVVSSTQWGAQRMEEVLTADPTQALYSAGEVAIYEVPIGAKEQGRTIQDLLADCACLAVALIRTTGASLPTPTMTLAAGDRLQVSATQAGIEMLRQRLQESEG